MRRRILVPLAILSVGLIGLWGYNQYVTRALWENRVETQYQRAFNDLTGNLGGLETQLAKASVSDSPNFLRTTMAEIWRLSYAAQEKLGQLPLGSVQLTRMKMLLAKVAAYAYRVSDRPAEELRLTAAEWKTLQGFRTQARYVSGQLTSMQANILLNNLRWVDVDRLNNSLGRTKLAAAAAAKRIGTNAVTKSLSMAENGLQRLPDPGFPESAVIYRPTAKGLTGANVSVTQARDIALRFVGGTAKSYSSRFLGKIKSDIGSFVFQLTPKAAGKKLTATRIGVTQKGGHVSWMLAERAYGPRRINLASATMIAERFVKDKGFESMTVVSKQEFDRVDLITLVPKADGVLYYPEMVKVQIAMDNGQVVGYEGVPYLTYHDPNRTLGAAAFTADQAGRYISPHLDVDRIRQSVVVDSRNNEVLAYEVAGSMKGEHFLVYLNAKDGSEVKIRRVDANGVEID